MCVIYSTRLFVALYNFPLCKITNDQQLLLAGALTQTPVYPLLLSSFVQIIIKLDLPDKSSWILTIPTLNRVSSLPSPTMMSELLSIFHMAAQLISGKNISNRMYYNSNYMFRAFLYTHCIQEFLQHKFDVSRYSKAEVGYGLRANQINPEVRLTSRNTNPLIVEQMAELNKATRHLNNAKLGINVDWLDFDGKIDISLAIVCYLCCFGSLIISFLVLYLCFYERPKRVRDFRRKF